MVKKNLIENVKFLLAVSALTLMLPILAVSYAFLYVYYKWCHPWLKEGVSLGFEPNDQEMWKFSSSSSSGGKRFTE